MLSAIIRRIGGGILTLLLVTMLVFVIFRALPSDPSRVLLGVFATDDLREDVRARLALDDPIPIQYARYVGNLARGNLGVSYFSGRPVRELIVERLPQTLMLAAASLPIALLAVFFGAWSIRHDGRWGAWIESLSGSIAALPVFLVAVLLSYFFGYVFRLLPANGYEPGWASLRYLVLPAISISVYPFCLLFRLTREHLRVVMMQQYVMTGRAIGLSPGRLVYWWGLRNVGVPLVTALSSIVAFYLAGAFFVETIYSWPGLGLLAFDAIQRYDYPLVLGVVLFASFAFIATTILTDMVSMMIDPRLAEG